MAGKEAGEEEGEGHRQFVGEGKSEREDGGVEDGGKRREAEEVREGKGDDDGGEGGNEEVEERRLRRVRQGFHINSMSMRDGESRQVLWDCNEWSRDMFTRELEARIPSRILECRVVSRKIEFTSREQMDAFRLVQRICLHGRCIEQWRFEFGFVIAGSTNSWEQEIFAADEQDMLPAEVLSGNLTIDTTFFDGEHTIGQATVRVFYE